LEELDRMSRVHITNPEELASLCLETGQDDALTALR
jgi:hypothetical protein